MYLMTEDQAGRSESLASYYENTPIQIYRKIHQKLNIFR